MNETLFFTTIILLKALLFYFLPTLNGKNTLFGFPVGENENFAEASDILNKYRFGLWAITLFSLLGIFAASYYSPKSPVYLYILFEFLPIWWLYKNFKRSWKLRKPKITSRFAASLKPRRLADYTNVFWETAVILLTVLPIVALIYFYPQLPETIPVHWNFNGEIDRWAKKNIASVFLISIIGVVMQILLLLTKQDIVRARLRIPAENAGQILPLKEIVHSANIGMMDWCRLMIAVLFAVINLWFLSDLKMQSFANFSGGSGFLTAIILLFVGIAYYARQIVLANRQIREVAGQIVFQTSAEEEGWKDGLFYNNESDAAFFVEKPDGMGYTFNFADKRVYLYIAIFALLTLIPVFAEIFTD